MAKGNNNSDSELVVLYQHNKDNDAFASLYNRYHEKVYHYCLGLLKDKDNAQDVTHDIFLKVARHLGSLKKPVTFPSWLFRIARNECLDTYKTEGRFSAISEPLAERISDEETDLAGLLSREQRFDAIEELMKEIDDDARLMLQLKYLEKRSIQDIQEKFRLSESAVKMRLSRARHRIEALYRRRYAGNLSHPAPSETH